MSKEINIYKYLRAVTLLLILSIFIFCNLGCGGSGGASIKTPSPSSDDRGIYMTGKVELDSIQPSISRSNRSFQSVSPKVLEIVTFDGVALTEVTINDDNTFIAWIPEEKIPSKSKFLKDSTSSFVSSIVIKTKGSSIILKSIIPELQITNIYNGKDLSTLSFSRSLVSSQDSKNITLGIQETIESILIEKQIEMMQQIPAGTFTAGAAQSASIASQFLPQKSSILVKVNGKGINSIISNIASSPLFLSIKESLKSKNYEQIESIIKKGESSSEEDNEVIAQTKLLNKSFQSFNKSSTQAQNEESFLEDSKQQGLVLLERLYAKALNEKSSSFQKLADCFDVSILTVSSFGDVSVQEDSESDKEASLSTMLGVVQSQLDKESLNKQDYFNLLKPTLDFLSKHNHGVLQDNILNNKVFSEAFATLVSMIKQYQVEDLSQGDKELLKNINTFFDNIIDAIFSEIQVDPDTSRQNIIETIMSNGVTGISDQSKVESVMSYWNNKLKNHFDSKVRDIFITVTQDFFVSNALPKENLLKVISTNKDLKLEILSATKSQFSSNELSDFFVDTQEEILVFAGEKKTVKAQESFSLEATFFYISSQGELFQTPEQTSWKLVSGNPNNIVIFTNKDSLKPKIEVSQEGLYTFEITAIFNQSLKSSQVQVLVLKPEIQAPKVISGFKRAAYQGFLVSSNNIKFKSFLNRPSIFKKAF